MEQKFDKRILKMTPQELEQHLQFRKKGFVIQNKKGKGSYKRKNKYNTVGQPSGKAQDFDSCIPMVRAHPRQPTIFIINNEDLFN